MRSDGWIGGRVRRNWIVRDEPEGRSRQKRVRRQSRLRRYVHEARPPAAEMEVFAVVTLCEEREELPLIIWSAVEGRSFAGI
jgi:hypothetical protein